MAVTVACAHSRRNYVSCVLSRRVSILFVGLWLGLAAAHGQDGTWTPGSSDWNTAANWTPSTAVPTGIATFGSAATTTITFSSSASVGTLQFNAGAPAYSFTLATNSVFNITGAGIINNSSNLATFTTSNSGGLQFQNSSTAGSAVLITNSTGITSFENTSTGGQARVITNAGGIFDISGLTSGGMTVGSIEGAGTYELGANLLTVGNTLSTIVGGNIVDAGAFAGTGGGLIKVGTSTLTLSGVDTYTGGTTVSAGTLQAGSIAGFSSASAFTVNAALDLDGFSNSVGSLGGSGTVTNSGGSSAVLTAGGNGTSTTFSGALIDGTNSVGFTKMGAGTLTLSGSNTYSGVTTVSAGTLQAGSITGFSSASAFTVNSILDLNGFSNSVGSLAGSGTVTNSGGGPAILTAGGNGTTTAFSGTLSDGASSFGFKKTGAGTLTLSGNNIYSGVTTVSAGTLQAGSATAFSSNSDFTIIGTLDLHGFSNSVGSLAGSGTVTNTGVVSKTLTAGGDNTSTVFSGILSNGPGLGVLSLTKSGTGTLTLTGTDTYTGGTTIGAGTLQIGNGTTGSIAGNIADVANLAFNRSNAATFAGVISGAGTVTQNGPGTLILSGSSTTFTGATTVASGTLEVDGKLGTAASSVNVQSGAILSGQGTIGGSVTIQNGGILAPGPGSNALSLGPLSLNPSSILDYKLTPGGAGLGTTGLVSVAGNLTLQGTLNVTNGGNFGPGAYQLFGYTGTLNELTLTLGTLPAGFTAANVTLTTTVAHQVNLVVTSASNPTQFWDGSNPTFDGTVHGGTGTWDNLTDNFIDAAITTHQAWQNGFAVFSVAGGTVTIGDDIAFQGIEFTSNGYSVVGAGGFTLDGTGAAMIVANGGVTATIAAPIIGTVGLNKSGLGTIILTGANTYSGGTTMAGGILSVANDAILGALSGGLTLSGGELLAGNGFVTARPVSLTTGSGGTLAAPVGGEALFSANITGSGNLTIGDAVNTGTVSLSATSSYTGTTTVATGATLQAFSTSALSSSSAFTVNGILDLAGFTNQIGSLAGTGTVTNTGAGGNVLTVGTETLIPSTVFSGVIQDGTAATVQLIKTGTGTLTLSGANTYSAGTTISAGTLQIGNSGATGSIAGDVTDNAILAFKRTNALTYAGTVSGTGSLSQLGTGTLTLTGTNTYGGGTTITAGTLQIGGGGTTGSIIGNVTDNSNFAFNRTDIVTSSGIVSGTGTLTQAGTGTLTLTAADTYSGGTTIGAGILQIGNGGTTGSIVGNVTDSANLSFDRTDVVTYLGVVSGAGTVSQIGTGTLTLTGTNTYTGGTTISAGTLQIGGGGTTGSIVGNVTDGGSLAFNHSVALTYAGVVSGAGTLSQIGTGTLTLTGANTYTGGTAISAGALQIGNGGTTGSIVGDVSDTGGFSFNHTDSVTFAGIVSGTGSLSQVGTGTLTLTGADTYAGGTTISAGTLQIGNGGTIGNIAGNVTDNGNLAFSRTDNVTFPGIVSGTGTLKQIGTGTLILNAADTYSGGTTISAGILQIGNGGIIGSIVGNVTDSSNLSFDRTDGITYAGIVSGAGALSQIGTGTLILTSANTYTGGTTISAGTLQIGGGGTTGSIIGNVTDSASLAFSRSNALTYSGLISGAGALSQIGTGTLTLTGANTYTGGTIISAGILQIGSGGTIGSIVGNVSDNGNLTFNHTDNVIFAGLVSGTGTLNKIGAGSLTLTAPDTYAGGTTISAGTLQVGNGGITGSIVGNATDNSSLVFNRTDTVILPGVVSGAGSLSQAGTGTLTLTATDTYTGGTTISAGTLQIGNGGTTGSIVGNVADNGVLAFARSDPVTFTGAISGSGALDQLGPDTLTLTGLNTFNGGALIGSGSALRVGNDNELGAAGVGLRLQGGELETSANFNSNRPIDSAIPAAPGPNILAAAAGTAATYSGIVSDGGGLVIGDPVNSGTVVLTNVNNAYTGGTMVSGTATLSVASDTNLGDAAGAITLQNGELLTTANGFSSARAITLATAVSDDTLAAAAGTTATYTGIISGSGGLTVGQGVATGTVVLTGNNTYSFGNTLINASSTLQIGNGGSSGSIIGNVADNGNLVYNRSDPVIFSGNISGTGTLNQNDAGTTILTGTSTYTGATTVAAGNLQVDGALGNTALTVQNAATLSGQGTIGGTVTIADGGHLAPGPGAQTLGVGSLLLNSGSILNYTLSTPGVIGSGVNSLVNVAGNLTLAGVLNVTNGGSFGSGSYRLLNYGGDLTDDGLTLGSLPAGFSASNGTVTTGVPGQVNLVVSSLSAPTQFGDGPQTTSDGTVHGGTGTWDNFTTNFTNVGVTQNQSWQNGVAVFAANPGTVTLDANINFQGIQFTSDGYTIVGVGAFELDPLGTATISTDPGVTATISAPINGTGGLDKEGAGSLVLTGKNAYSGGTTVSGGVLSVATDSNLGGGDRRDHPVGRRIIDHRRRV